MFTTLIVDDEERALSGICRTFPWDDYGFKIVFSTTDPIKAIDFLRAHHVDLAFVDIRMPELSGLDIIQLAREEELGTDFVIVSGHSEFEFARDALRQGVLDYCLKPIRADAAVSVLERAAVHLRQAREDRLRNETAHPPLDLRTLREKFSEPLPYYCAAVCVEDLTSKTTYGSEAPEFVPDLRFVRSTAKNELIYVFNFQGGAPLNLLVANRGAWRLGFGAVCSKLEMISTSLESAREALTASSFYPAEQVFSLTPVKDAAITGIASDLIDALDTGMIVVAEKFFDGLPAVMRRERLMPWDARRLRNRVLKRVVDRFKNATAGADTLTTTLEGFCEGLRLQVLRTICPEAQQAFAAAGTSERMHSILAFVHQHIDTRLTLRELSEVFHFNPNYGCELFKRYTGMRFSEYIVRMKLWHARHLLVRTDKPVAVVAEDVGYDYYHFNKLFKKHEGVTPRNYRASHMV